MQLAEDRNLFKERNEKLIKELQLLRAILIINRTDAICLAWLLHSFICSFRNIIIRHVSCEDLLFSTQDTKMIRHKDEGYIHEQVIKATGDKYKEMHKQSTVIAGMQSCRKAVRNISQSRC